MTAAACSPLPALLGALVIAAAQRDQDALVLKDAGSGTWLHADARMAEWLGRPAETLAGSTDADWFGESAASLRSADQAAAAAPGATLAEHRIDLQGARREFSVLRLRVEGPQGQALLAQWWRDLAPQRRREAQLRNALEQLEQQQQANAQLRRELQGQEAPRDSASGLYSRAHFDDQVRREVDLSTREHREFALVAIELDPPAPDVAALGDAAQQRVHDAVGRLLRGNTRAMDASCRYDERRFAVLLSGVGLATAHSRMEGLRRQCATQIVAFEGREIGFTVSMGVASFPHTAHTHEQLSAACESALADARERGGNRVTLASIRFESG